MVREETELSEIDFIDAKSLITSLIKREEHSTKYNQILYTHLKAIGIHPFDLKELENLQPHRVRIEALKRFLMRVNDLEVKWKARKDEFARSIQEEWRKVGKRRGL